MEPVLKREYRPDLERAAKALLVLLAVKRGPGMAAQEEAPPDQGGASVATNDPGRGQRRF